MGELVTKRRTELRYDVAGLARFAEVDPKTLSSLERGERWPRISSRSRIEEALKWECGSLDELLAGRDAVTQSPEAANYPGKSEHVIQMAIMDAIGKVQAVYNIALAQRDMHVLKAVADVLVALTQLLHEEASGDEAEAGLLDEVTEALESVNEHGGPDQARNAH